MTGAHWDMDGHVHPCPHSDPWGTLRKSKKLFFAQKFQHDAIRKVITLKVKFEDLQHHLPL